MADNDTGEDDPRERIQLSLAQIAASCLAAVSAAVLCSFFGVAGTVIGTAIASFIATVGSALYAHSMRRTKARLRRLHRAGATAPPLTEVIKTARQQGRRWFGQIRWRLVGIGAVAVFVVSLGVVTVIEVGIGEPLSALLGVSHSGNRNTTLGSATDTGPHRHSKSTHSPSPSPSPSKSGSSNSPTPSPTPTVTVTDTPSKTPKPTPTPKPSSGTPTVSPTTSSSSSKR